MASIKSKTKATRLPKKQKKVAVEIGHEEDDDTKPGCVYLGHIPHGFYEEQMKQYFSQFGKVLDVRVCRSKKNSHSKGYGFVKFRYSAVAKTVAETCHNYLFFNKLLKCVYKPMSQIHNNTFKNFASPINLPKSQQNNKRSEYQIAKAVSTSLSKAEKKLKQLKSSGLDIDLGDVMDVPADMSKIEEVISTQKPKRKVKITAAKIPSGEPNTNTPSSTVTTPEAPSAKRRQSSASPAVSTTPATKRRKLVAESTTSLCDNESQETRPASTQVSAKASNSNKKNQSSDAESCSKSPVAVLTTPEAPASKRRKTAVTPTTSLSDNQSHKKTQPASTPESVKKSPKANKDTSKDKSPVASKVAASTPKTKKTTPKKTPEPKLREKKSPKSPNKVVTPVTPGSRKRKRV